MRFDQSESIPIKPLKISVVILTWNRVDDLMTALGSVYRQIYDRVEVILVDSASTDSTPQTVLAAYPDIKYLRLPYNLGVAGGRNVGIANASGDLIILLDDDAEFLENNAFQQISDRFTSEPELAVMYFRYILIDGEEWEWSFPYQKIPELDGHKLYGTSFVGCAHCISRQWIDRIGYLKVEFFREGEEADYAYRVIARGGRILYEPKITVLHRLNPHQRILSEQLASKLAHRTENDIIYLDLKEAILIVVWRLAANLIRSLTEGWFRGYLLGCWRLILATPRILQNRKPMDPEGIMLHRTLRSYAVLDYKVATQTRTSLRDWLRVRRTHQPLGVLGQVTPGEPTANEL